MTISRLLAAADLELRARLESYDDHDDVLNARRTALTPEQQAQHAAAFEHTSQVLAEARRSATASPCWRDGQADWTPPRCSRSWSATG